MITIRHESVTTVTGHANHLVHAALAGVEQIVTDSSASRQLRFVQWRETQPPFDAAAAKAILSDTHDAKLPIYRLAADDPDEENTLALAATIFVKAHWLSLYSARGLPCFSR